MTSRLIAAAMTIFLLTSLAFAAKPKQVQVGQDGEGIGEQPKAAKSGKKPVDAAAKIKSQLQKSFKSWDRNKDDSVHKEEFDKFHARFKAKPKKKGQDGVESPPDPMAAVAAMHAKMDGDQDAKISREFDTWSEGFAEYLSKFGELQERRAGIQHELENVQGLLQRNRNITALDGVANDQLSRGVIEYEQMIKGIDEEVEKLDSEGDHTEYRDFLVQQLFAENAVSQEAAMLGKILAAFLILAAIQNCVSLCRAANLAILPPNTWVKIEYATEQPAAPDEKGEFARQGWNKLVYDPDGRRVLFYDRWIDKKHGGYTIYGNCLFAFDPAAARLTPLKIDNWTKFDTKEGGYRTQALPENEAEPTPCPRHVYHAFEYVSDLKAVFLCNGANQTALRNDGTLVGHDLCDGAWRLDLPTNKWTRIDSTEHPPNLLDDAMAYCPDIRSIVYSGFGRQLWILDLAKGQWRKALHSPPARTSFGQEILYDPTHRRIILAGGGPLDAWKKKESAEFRELYAFDPQAETVERLADCPTAFYATHLAFDQRRERFITVAVFDQGEQPSGMFAYDPAKNAWQEIHPENAIPPHNNWFGWMQLCYDSHDDCLIGKVNNDFFAFRYVPEN